MILLDPDLDSHPAPASQRRGRSAGSSANLKQDRLPSARSLGAFLRTAQAAVRLRGQVSVLLTGDDAMRRLNRQFRRKNKSTDVLSFPGGDFISGEERIAGDLAISVDTARRQAAEQGHALEIELQVLILHGLLHLAGFDHETDEGEMARREQKLRARLQLPLGLIERSETPVLSQVKRRKDEAGRIKASAVGDGVSLRPKSMKMQPRILHSVQDDSRAGALSTADPSPRSLRKLAQDDTRVGGSQRGKQARSAAKRRGKRA